MRTKEFDRIMQDTMEGIKQILTAKNDEYATDTDRLHNFNTAAELAHTTSEMALRGMLAKHIVSVWDLIDKSEDGDFANYLTWNEKIMDSIVYMCLLRAIVWEKWTAMKRPTTEKQPFTKGSNINMQKSNDFLPSVKMTLDQMLGFLKDAGDDIDTDGNR